MGIRIDSCFGFHVAAIHEFFGIFHTDWEVEAPRGEGLPEPLPNTTINSTPAQIAMFREVPPERRIDQKPWYTKLLILWYLLSTTIGGFRLYEFPLNQAA